jgi:WD40 repeat protein
MQTPKPPPGTTLFRYTGHYEHTYTLAWSPDGTRMVSVNSYNGAIELWDVATGQHLAFCPRLPMIHVAAWSPDGEYVALASTGMPGTIHIWHPKNNAIVSKNQDGGHDNWSSSLGWSPDSNSIASSSHRHSVQVWEAATGLGISNYLGHTTTITGVAWSPDGRYIASASMDGLIQVWDAATAATLTSFHQYTEGATAIAWSPDSTYLASACPSEIFVWEALTGKIIMAGQHKAHGQMAVAWSPDGTRVVSNAFGSNAIVWDPFHEKILCTYDDPTSDGSDVAWSPDGQWIATAGQGVTIWNAHSGETRLVRGDPPQVTDAKPSPDGQYVASACHNPILLWNAQTGECQGACGDLADHQMTVAFAWSPDGMHIATAHIYGALVVWKDVLTRGQRREVQVYQQSGDSHDPASQTYVRALAWSPDGSQLACTRQHQVEVWSVATQEKLLVYHHNNDQQHEASGGVNLVWALSWAPDGSRIVSCENNRVQVWDPHSGTCLSVYDVANLPLEEADSRDPYESGFRTVAWSPDGRFIAAARGSTILVWTVEDGELMTAYRGHRRKVYILAWSPDSTCIASGAELDEARFWPPEGNRKDLDRFVSRPVVHVWRVGIDEREPCFVYRGHAPSTRVFARIQDIHWFPDGKRVVSACQEVLIWQAR